MSDNSLKRSSLGLINKIKMKLCYDCLNILVEDTGKEYIYEELFEKFKLEYDFKVISTGCKNTSKICFESFCRNGAALNYKVFFIVDGDFDVFLDRIKISAPNYFYLERYNIENYFIQEDAVYSAIRSVTGLTIKEIKKIFNFSFWFNKITSEAAKLYLIFMFSQKLNLGLKTVGMKNYEYLDINTGYLKENVIDGVIAQFADFDAFDEEIEIFERSLSSDDCSINMSYIICGKFYLDSLRSCVQSSVNKSNKTKKFSIKVNEFQNLIRATINVECLRDLQIAMDNYMNYKL